MSKTYSRILVDYKDNFMPRKEVDIRLTFEEMKELLQDKEFLHEIRLNWHLKFYAKQLFILSWKGIQEEKTISSEHKRKEIIVELLELVAFSGSNEARALVALVRLRYFLDDISTHVLYDMFSGTDMYDDYCAQEAYHEYNRRGRK